MILAKSALLEAIKNGDIKIEPFDESLVGPGSIDMHLGNLFRVFDQSAEPIKAIETVNATKISRLQEVKSGEVFELEPAQTILGVTVETITLSDNMAGWIEGRSRFARIGLGVHITSGFIQPGISNHQVLEITNLGPNIIELVPGVAVCQVIFERCEGRAKYGGIFSKQDAP